MKRLEVLGKKFGELVVISDAPAKTGKYPRRVRCRCSCGKVLEVALSHITSGHTKSCGCYKIKQQLKHGKSGTRTYTIWQGMLKRGDGRYCTEYYAKRGITVCKRWLKFENFLNDMGEAPKGMSLDRINNNKGYSKRNCRWATRKEQARNTRSNRMLTFAGQTLCLAEMAEKWGIKPQTLNTRLREGWSLKKALTAPIKEKRILTYKGKRKTVAQWSVACGISPCAINGRLKSGWTTKEALETPLKR